MSQPVVALPGKLGFDATYLLFDCFSVITCVRSIFTGDMAECAQAVSCFTCGLFVGLRETDKGSDIVNAIILQPEAIKKKPQLALWQPVAIFSNLIFVRYFDSFNFRPFKSGMAMRAGVVLVRFVRGDCWGRSRIGVQIR